MCIEATIAGSDTKVCVMRGHLFQWLADPSEHPAVSVSLEASLIDARGPHVRLFCSSFQGLSQHVLIWSAHLKLCGDWMDFLGPLFRATRVSLEALEATCDVDISGVLEVLKLSASVYLATASVHAISIARAGFALEILQVATCLEAARVKLRWN